MPPPLSDELRQKIRQLRSRGKPIAAVASELGVSVGVVHKVCTAGARKPAKKAPAARTAAPMAAPVPATAEPPRSAEPQPTTTEAPEVVDAPEPFGAKDIEELIAAEGGDADLGMLSLQIGRCEGYLADLDGQGNYQAVVQVERLIADLVERRRKLRPPPPPDPEEIALVRMRERDELVTRIEKLVTKAEGMVEQALHVAPPVAPT